MRRLALLCLLLWSLPAAMASEQTYILHSLNASGLATALRPLLPVEAVLIPYQDRLILRTTAEHYAELLPLIQELDRPPRSLRISLRRSGSQREQSQSLDRHGIAARQQSGQDQQQITLIALEGHSAHIDQGTLVRLTGLYGETYLAELEGGLEVLPQVDRDGGVRLQLGQREVQWHADSGQAATQTLRTTLSLSPGRWREVGHLQIQQRSRQLGTDGVQTSRSQVSLPLEVKVELIDP
ncbi:hypothetical protein [Isoalcanivorax beigongshangi]|uniref:Type II/III secretion system protein n=1 Tax=Isoalcanivorax beigongshangi TaxID=3238810 RepID=A0ABV4AJQ7_9GAMM